MCRRACPGEHGGSRAGRRGAAGAEPARRQLHQRGRVRPGAGRGAASPAGSASGRADGLAEPGDYLTADVCGESIIVTRADDGGLARLLQPVPAPRLAAGAARPGSAGRAGQRGGFPGTRPLPVPRLDLRAGRDAARRAVPARRCASTGPRCRCTGSTWPPGAGSCSPGSTPAAAAPPAGRLAGGHAGRDHGPAGRLPAGRPAHRRPVASTRWPPTGRSSWRTTTSATTAARSTRSCATWCRPSAAAAATWTGTAGIPHRAGRLPRSR